MRNASRLAALLVALAIACVEVRSEPTTTAESPRLTLRQAADAVLAALQTTDRAAIEGVAERDEPDPWRIADELCHRGEFAAAEALAEASPRPALEKLPAYVASLREEMPDERAEREAVEAALAALGTGARPVLAALKHVEANETSVPSILVHRLRGSALRSMGRLQESAAAFRVAAERALSLGWYAAAIKALGSGGMSASMRGDQEGARLAWEKLLALFERLERRHDAAGVLLTLASVYKDQGDYAKAIAGGKRALAILEEYEDWPNIAVALGGLGNAERLRGAYERALHYQERSLSVALKLNHPQLLSHAYMSLANVHAVVGAYARAIPLYEQSLALDQQGGKKRDAAVALENLARVRHRLGDAEHALSDLGRATRLFAGVGDHAGVARALGITGRIHVAAGELEEAASSFARAAETLMGLGNRVAAADAIGNLSDVQRRLGNPERATVLLHRSLELHEAAGARESLARGMGQLSLLLLDKGDPEAALAANDRGLKIAEAIASRATVTALLQSRTAMLHQAGRHGDAIAAGRRAVEEAMFVTGGLGQEEGARARDLWARLFESATASAAALKDVDALLYFLEQGRAGSLREALGSRDTLEAAVLPLELREAMGEARRAERRAMASYATAQRGGRRREARMARDAWVAARDRVLQETTRVERAAKQAAAFTLSEPDGVRQVQSRLAGGEALVLYGAASEGAVALVLRRDAARIVDLPEAAAIEAAVGRLLDHDRRVDPDQVPALRALIVEPLALGADVTRVLVSPVGRLGYVPFALLLPDRAVAYLPSGTTHGLLADEKLPRGRRVLAFGDPDYQAPADALAVRGHPVSTMRLARLPDTRQEVEAIADVGLIHDQASETGVQDAVKREERWRAVHFACHGLVDPQQPMLSSLALTADADTDGFLTALEIFRMQIPADLVVMSACETGKGKIYRTEGIVGLTRAFMFAGASRVICSLWKVDDEATQALMIRFYELWDPDDGKGLGAAAALKQAQAYVRDHPEHPEWKHPYYWAAWVLWGLPD